MWLSTDLRLNLHTSISKVPVVFVAAGFFDSINHLYC